MRANKERSVPRDVLLFDRARLGDLQERYGPETEIKKHVDTAAKLYEIRTALRYWFGGRNDHRTCDVVWNRCEAVKHGRMELRGDELVWPDGEMA